VRCKGERSASGVRTWKSAIRNPQSAIRLRAKPALWLCASVAALSLPAATRTAAEINLHIGETDAAFVAACIERGVKIALGSDAHQMWEVGLLARHVEVLQQAAGTTDIAALLFA
jgi:hypothetical protein